jgi:hypothetical protein
MLKLKTHSSTHVKTQNTFWLPKFISLWLEDGNSYLRLRTMSHTIYAAKFEQTIIHQNVHLRRESQSHVPAHVLWILITPLVSSNSSSYMYEPYDENTLWRLLRVSISRLLLRFSLTNSNITSLFRFVTKRTIYRLGIISLAHAPVHVTDFSVVNVHFDELSSARIWRQNVFWVLTRVDECVLSFNMGWRI